MKPHTTSLTMFPYLNDSQRYSSVLLYINNYATRDEVEDLKMKINALMDLVGDTLITD